MPAEARKRLGIAVAAAVVLMGLFVFFFVTPGHDAKPNGLPVVVAGPPGATGGIAARLEARDFEVERVPAVAQARQRIDDREAYGAFVLGGGAPRTLIATAASVPVAQLLTAIGREAGARAVVDAEPIDRDDPRGATLNLLVLSLVITSILSALMAVQMVPELRSLGPRVVATVAAAVFGALLAVGIVKGLGALPGPYITEAAIVALAIVGIAICSSGLLRLIGPAGTVVPFLLFLVIANPASGLASAPELLPTPWAEVGPFLPPGALGSALRGIAYFDGAKTLVPLLVLLAYCVIGVVLNQLASRRFSEPSQDHP